MASPFTYGLRGLLISTCAGLICWPFVDLAIALWIVWGSGLLTLATIDAKTRWLPDVMTLPFLTAGLLIQLWPESRSVGIEGSIIGMLMGGLPLWVMATLYRWKTGKDGLGLGDVKLVAAMGAWSGPAAIPFTIALGAACGLVWGFFTARHKAWLKRRIAFGPFLVIGYAVSVLVSWYSGWLPWI